MMKNLDSLVGEDTQEQETDENLVPDTPRRRKLKLAVLARMQSRRKSKEKPAEDEISVDEEDEVIQPIESMTSSCRPRRKLKLFKNFQSKKKNGMEQAAIHEEIDETPVDQVEYKEDGYDNIMLGDTGTLTDVDNISHVEEIEIEAEEPVDIMGDGTSSLNVAKSSDTGDSLIRSIRKQTSRMRRGKDPETNNTRAVARGIDP